MTNMEGEGFQINVTPNCVGRSHHVSEVIHDSYFITAAATLHAGQETRERPAEHHRALRHWLTWVSSLSARDVY